MGWVLEIGEGNQVIIMDPGLVDGDPNTNNFIHAERGSGVGVGVLAEIVYIVRKHNLIILFIYLLYEIQYTIYR